MAGVDKAVASEALGLAAAKLNLKTKLITRHDDPWG
jgi:ribosomal protein L16/L10AE